MATNQPKTDMINLAMLKLGGASSIGTAFLSAIDDTVFASPATATNETTKLACLRYPYALKQALLDIKPKFSRRYADCGLEIAITQNGAGGVPFEKADYERIFELPTDYLGLIAQISEDNRDTKHDAHEITVHSYAHIVKGTDDQAYYCKVAVTGAAANRPITGASYASYWALFNTDDAYGADWESGHAYKSAQTGRLLLANEYSNDDDDSAYIEYVAYSATGVSDIPTHYDQPFIEAFTTLLAAQMATWTKEFQAAGILLQQYRLIDRPDAEGLQAESDYEEEPTSWLDARTA